MQIPVYSKHEEICLGLGISKMHSSFYRSWNKNFSEMILLWSFISWVSPGNHTTAAFSQIDGLIQKKCNSITNTLELRHFCIMPLKWNLVPSGHHITNKILCQNTWIFKHGFWLAELNCCSSLGMYDKWHPIVLCECKQLSLLETQDWFN